MGRLRTRWRVDYTPPTPRELEVATLIVAGLENKAIGERLYLSPRTVQTHLSSLFKKLNVANRTQLATLLKEEKMKQTTYTRPSTTVTEAELRAQAARRRAALVAGGCATYGVGLRNGVPGIICLCCGLGSSSHDDIKNRYCGFCREQHSDWREGTDRE